MALLMHEHVGRGRTRQGACGRRRDLEGLTTVLSPGCASYRLLPEYRLAALA